MVLDIPIVHLLCVSTGIFLLNMVSTFLVPLGARFFQSPKKWITHAKRYPKTEKSHGQISNQEEGLSCSWKLNGDEITNDFFPITYFFYMNVSWKVMV